MDLSLYFVHLLPELLNTCLSLLSQIWTHPRSFFVSLIVAPPPFSSSFFNTLLQTTEESADEQLNVLLPQGAKVTVCVCVCTCKYLPNLKLKQCCGSCSLLGVSFGCVTVMSTLNLLCIKFGDDLHRELVVTQFYVTWGLLSLACFYFKSKPEVPQT